MFSNWQVWCSPLRIHTHNPSSVQWTTAFGTVPCVYLATNNIHRGICAVPWRVGLGWAGRSWESDWIRPGIKSSLSAMQTKGPLRPLKKYKTPTPRRLSSSPLRLLSLTAQREVGWCRVCVHVWVGRQESVRKREKDGERWGERMNRSWNSWSSQKDRWTERERKKESYCTSTSHQGHWVHFQSVTVQKKQLWKRRESFHSHLRVCVCVVVGLYCTCMCAHMCKHAVHVSALCACFHVSLRPFWRATCQASTMPEAPYVRW